LPIFGEPFFVFFRVSVGGDGSGGYRSEEDLEFIREAVRKKLAVFDERDALGAVTQAREVLEKRVGKRL
jgi:hypothetical protein